MNTLKDHGRLAVTSALSTADLLVKISSGELVVTAADTDVAYGVCPQKADAGQRVETILAGECYLIADGAITAATTLAPSTGGAVKDAETGDAIIGRSIEGASDGDRFLAILYLDKSRTVA